MGRKLKLLVAYSNAWTFVATTMEYLRSFKLHSRCEVSYLHVTDGAEIDFDLNGFDAVLVSHCARLCYPGYVSRSFCEALKRFRGVRLLAVQDEYEHTNRLRQAIQDLQFDVVFTCVPPDGLEYVYPRSQFPDTEFVTVLTGYVPQHLTERGRGAPLAGRPIWVGYRGRRLPAYYGQLGQDKFEIGEGMRAICARRGIPHDIASTEDKRIYGERWYDFMASCRAMLGTESGSNVFDFDGSLARRYENFKTRSGSEPSYEEFAPSHELEARVSMGQISPRIFEAAALGTPLILFPGHYSGAVRPDEHYLELRKDFSNADLVLDALADTAALEAMAERAYDELIGSGKYSYGRFVAMVDDTIARKHAEKPAPSVASITSASVPLTPDPVQPSRKELPTLEPRDFLFHKYREAYFAHEKLKADVEGLHGKSLNGFLRAAASMFLGQLKLRLVTTMPRLALALHRVSDNLRDLKSRA